MSHDPFEDARETARAVWLDTATIGPPPLTVWQRLEAALEAQVVALRAYGVITDAPTGPPTPDQADTAARLLAAGSRFPLYVDGDGWRRLRTYPTDIETAYAKAMKWVGRGEEQRAVELNAARRTLLAALAQDGGGG